LADLIRTPRTTPTDSLFAAGTLALSWGRYGGFYITRGRICLGWVALTHVTVEIDDLMRTTLVARDLTAARDEVDEAIRRYAVMLKEWNDPDDDHAKYMLRGLVEAALREVFRA